MTETTEDSLMIVTNSFPRAGRIFLIACGKMMKRMASFWSIPKERAASICPLLTALIPARTISAT